MQLNNMSVGILSNPKVLRAQEELDRGIGLDRPPNLPDEPNPPYVHGIIQEVMRWRPIKLTTNLVKITLQQRSIPGGSINIF